MKTGVKAPDDIQGRSLLPVLKNKGLAPADWRKAIYYLYSQYNVKSS